jgi:hypothetical protein
MDGGGKGKQSAESILRGHIAREICFPGGGDKYYEARSPSKHAMQRNKKKTEAKVFFF